MCIHSSILLSALPSNDLQGFQEFSLENLNLCRVDNLLNFAITTLWDCLLYTYLSYLPSLIIQYLIVMPKLVTLYPFKKLPFLASRDMSRPWTIKSGIWTWVTWCNMIYTYLTTVAARLTLWLYKTNVHLFNYCSHLEWILWHQTSILCLRMLNFSSKNLPPCIFQTWRHSSWEKPFTTWMQCYIHFIAVDNSIFSITTVVKWQ